MRIQLKQAARLDRPRTPFGAEDDGFACPVIPSERSERWESFALSLCYKKDGLVNGIEVRVTGLAKGSSVPCVFVNILG